MSTILKLFVVIDLLIAGAVVAPHVKPVNVGVPVVENSTEGEIVLKTNVNTETGEVQVDIVETDTPESQTTTDNTFESVKKIVLKQGEDNTVRIDNTEEVVLDATDKYTPLPDPAAELKAELEALKLAETKKAEYAAKRTQLIQDYGAEISAITQLKRERVDSLCKSYTSQVNGNPMNRYNCITNVVPKDEQIIGWKQQLRKLALGNVANLESLKQEYGY